MSDSALFKVYVVKFALAEGIRVGEATKIDGKTYWIDRSQWQPLLPSDYTLTETAAIQRAESMRRARIHALQGEIKRLERIDLKRKLPADKKAT